MNSRNRFTSAIVASLTLGGLTATQSVTAQAPATGLAMGIVEARQKNAALMKQYSWNTRLELIDDGKTKDTRIDQVTYGPDGNLQYTLLNDAGSPLPHGFLRRKIAESEKEKLENYMKDIRAMLNQYTLPTAAGVGTFLATATIQAPDANGMLQITGNNVVVMGDTLSISVNAPTRQTKVIKVTTTYEGDQVTLDASFKALANGLNYMAYATISIPKKKLTIQVQNYDYVNQNN